MDVGLFAIGIGRAADPDIIAQIARKADDIGFASLWAPEHTVLFDDADYTSRYPYNDTGRIMVGRGDLLDPFAALTFAAAHTSRIKLGTGICLVPHRNPLITAKMVASLDRLSKGRFLFGVGIGWLKEEFRALGVPPERRAQRTCEYLDAMKAVWTQEAPAYRGEFCHFPPVIYPTPSPCNSPIHRLFSGAIPSQHSAGWCSMAMGGSGLISCRRQRRRWSSVLGNWPQKRASGSTICFSVLGCPTSVSPSR